MLLNLHHGCNEKICESRYRRGSLLKNSVEDDTGNGEIPTSPHPYGKSHLAHEMMRWSSFETIDRPAQAMS